MLKNISIKAKIYFLVLVPIIAVLYINYLEINTKIIQKKEAEKIEKIVSINTKIASLINELQIERGLAGSFIESKEGLFKDRLSKQVEFTNISYQSLLKSFSNIKTDSLLGLKEFLIIFNNQLKIIREDTVKKHVSSSELISFYAVNIEYFLDFIYLSSDETTDIKLSRMILSHVKFLFAKEKNGLERVLVASLLIKNKISLNNKLKLNNLIILREKNLDFFLKLLENNDLKEQYEKNSYLNSQLKIKAIEKTFLKSFTLPRITPEEWFELMSTWINTQNEFSHQFSQQIILKSKTYKNDIINEMIILLFLSFLFLICFLFLLSYIYKDINKELDDIISSISFLSKNDLNKYNKIPINSNNELSKIASKFNELVIELKERESNTNKITKDLQKSKDDLEKSSKLKSEFLANMSHEIRTPLNAIVGFISILKEEEKDVKKREYFNIINSSSENLLEMINDILDFSKIEKNKVILDAKEINLLEELHNITDLFTFKLKEKEIVLDLDFAKDLPREILIDCLKLKQILTNLIGNAIKFAQNNTQIFFTVKIVKNKLYFSVRDEGIGIPLDKQNSIFEPFLQADNSTTRKYGGTGLGLTISKRLVETFGGNLELKSQSGKGSEFYFSIPFIESDNPIVSKEVKSDSTQYLKGKVLLVEDNKANQMFMKVILKKMNLTFDIANDGLEAIRKFTDNDYDLILMDENMPNMSGIEATKVILDLEEKNNLKHTPIIALTANALTGDRARFLNAGMDEYLTKPVNKKELFSLLNLFLVINNR